MSPGSSHGTYTKLVNLEDAGFHLNLFYQQMNSYLATVFANSLLHPVFAT
jgi:hypothetical protein